MEAHNGSSWDVQAEMAYNGLGQRLSMDAAGVIATYVMDGDRPLTAESNGNTTFYLYGLGTIGEKTTEWNFSLPDGTNTPRQLTDIQGEITLSARYTPWGDSLELHGTGNFSFGYLGGVLDATTGLLYVGNGQYYDPATGRFLTRNVNPDSTNPYVPWNPVGAILGPLGLIALVFGKRKKGSKAGTFLVLLLVITTLSMTLVACGGGEGNGQQEDQSLPADPNTSTNQNSVDTDPETDNGGTSSTATPPIILILPDCPTPIWTPTPTPIPTGTSTPSPVPTISVNISNRAETIRDWASELGYSVIDVLAVLLNREALNPSLVTFAIGNPYGLHTRSHSGFATFPISVDVPIGILEKSLQSVAIRYT